jgi:radical SAM-linked protein
MQQRYKVAIEFFKKREMVFISHLDMLRLFMRTFHKANIPLVYTQGFHPKPKLSFARALPLGTESKKEKMYIYLLEKVNIHFLRKDLNVLLPKGIQITKIQFIDRKK